MENSNPGKKVVKRVIKQQPQETKKKNSSVLRDIAFVVMFFMVFIVFVRGFGIKGTVKEQNELTKDKSPNAN